MTRSAVVAARTARLAALVTVSSVMPLNSLTFPLRCVTCCRRPGSGTWRTYRCRRRCRPRRREWRLGRVVARGLEVEAVEVAGGVGVRRRHDTSGGDVGVVHRGRRAGALDLGRSSERDGRLRVGRGRSRRSRQRCRWSRRRRSRAGSRWLRRGRWRLQRSVSKTRRAPADEVAAELVGAHRAGARVDSRWRTWRRRACRPQPRGRARRCTRATGRTHRCRRCRRAGRRRRSRRPWSRSGWRRPWPGRCHRERGTAGSGQSWTSVEPQMFCSSTKSWS